MGDINLEIYIDLTFVKWTLGRSISGYFLSFSPILECDHYSYFLVGFFEQEIQSVAVGIASRRFSSIFLPQFSHLP